MREPLKDRGRLEHIIEAIDKAFEFVEGVTFTDYVDNSMMRFAVVKCIEIVGEASYMLSKEFKEQHPEVEWRNIVGMRHVLVHGYYHINDNEVWNVIKNDLPKLRKQITEIIDLQIEN
jgi:uncharacterized protein with HEPN domain